MIGSVTKLILYAVSLAAAHKDGVTEEGRAFKGSPLSGHRFDARRVRLADISRDSDSPHEWRTIDISVSVYERDWRVLLLVIKYKNSEQLYIIELKN